MLGLRTPAERREQLILSAVFILFASVFATRVIIEDIDQPTALLYALPITVVAVEYGARAGLLSAGVALALFALYTRFEAVELGALGWITRAMVFFLLGGLVGILSDRLRDAHRTVQNNEAQLKGILDNTTSVVYLKDVEGHYLLVNRRFEELFGVSQGDVAGKTDYDLFPKYSADAFRAADRKVLKTREPVEVEETAPHRDGPHTYISIKFPVRDPDGEPYAICGISTDITARIRAEQQVRESREQFRKIIDTAQEAFVSIDAESKITGWNDEAERTFGYSPEQAIGKPIYELILPERYHQQHLEGIRRFLATGEARVLNRRMELTARHRDGREFPIEIAVSALRTRNGYTFNAFLHDISERKRTEELARIKAGLERQTAELKRSNLELAQFAHVASHDLSEPLQTVARYVQLIDHRYRGRLDDDADEFIGYAVEGASRMQALINGLRAYSTLGSAEHSPHPVDCDEVVRSALDSLRVTIDQAGAAVTVDPLPTVAADATQLGVVFQNLVSNAVKFAREESPRVHISAERESDGWRFGVSDNGIGIKPEHRERIFEMFRRLHARERYEGTGIGLTICKKIVTRHGGRIWAEEAPGGGSMFCFTLPDEQSATTTGVSAGAPVARRA
jgi:PAS domain S-box-containing protein